MCACIRVFIFLVISSLVNRSLDGAVEAAGSAGAAVGPPRLKSVERNHVAGVLPGRRLPKSSLQYRLYAVGGQSRV